MVVCILCCLESSLQQQIGLFSEEGLLLNVCSIIAKHFWLKPNIDLYSGQQICMSCWEALRDFHQFYLRVAESHNHFECKVATEFEDDPLPPQEVLLKTEGLSSAGQLIQALGDNFFDSEVKVEVNDLDLLPQIEIIEDIDVTGRSTRANRRGRQNVDSGTAKRIKQEHSPTANNSNDESEAELPLAVLMTVGFKADPKNDPTRTTAPIDDALIKDAATSEPQKKRRGRPRKVKETDSNKMKNEDLKSAPISEDITSVVKAEQTPACDSADDDNEFLSADIVSGTDESGNSSSSESSDSNESWPDPPLERYAEIPKRVIVKPKKYRKREKPLVPPKRMTREQIERKNIKQAEYEKVIVEFYKKFPCPKCSLLVQNFSEMKSHFRASHNDDHGYLTCCGRKFHLRKTLAEHVYVHWNPEHFKCSISACSRIFQDSRSLEVHELTHTNPPDTKEKKVFQCDKCPKAFTTKAAFEYHTTSKHVPKSEFQFTCTECNKKLPTLRKLKDHIKYMHNPESAIICDKCGKTLRNHSNLKKHHLLEHSDVPRPEPVPMQCEICGTWLRHLAGLKQHMKTIHEEAAGEHRCHICNKTSVNARALKRHIYHNHECERKFKCTMCEKAFKRPQDLREHTSTHTGEVLYTCPNCPMTFFSNANMYKHRQRLHRAEWESDKKKPVPPNIMKQATGATAAMKMQQAVGSASAFFANKRSLSMVSQLAAPNNANNANLNLQ